MEKTYITSKHFKKLLTSQPFFIWNSLEELENEKAEPDTNHFWNKVIEEAEIATYNEVSARTVSKFDKWLRDKIQKDFETVIIKGTKEEQIHQTLKALNGKKIIISPVFEFEGAIAQPFAFNPVEKRAYYIKYSKKTKASDLIKPYWDFHIISKHTAVWDIKMFLPIIKRYTKGEIDLRPINAIQPTKTSKLPFQKNRNGEITDVNILDFCKKPKLKFMTFPRFQDALDKIKNSKEEKLDANKLQLDLDQIAVNPFKNEILSKLNFKYANWNGNVIKKKDILSFYNDGNDEVFHSNIVDTIKNISSAKIDKTKDIVEIKKIKEAKKVIWYDFEGYSLPYAPIDNIAPHQQLVFQVSVIETIDGKETRLSNFVLDPKTLKSDDLFKIIEEVYSNGADAYVVYNKGYEIPRMKEIVELLKFELNSKSHKALKMIDEIEEKTIDLMNVFKIKSKNTIPPVLMHDQYAKASIKNVEKHISQNKIKLPRPIKQYANLEVKNGGMAMEVAIHRAIGIIGDAEWKLKVIALKEYCENDVRAMIMVYDFAKYLLDINGIN